MSAYVDGADAVGRALVAAGMPVPAAGARVLEERSRRRAEVRRYRPDLANRSYHTMMLTGTDMAAAMVLTREVGVGFRDVDETGLALADAVLRVRAAVTTADARILLDAARSHVEHRRRMRAPAELDSLAHRVLGAERANRSRWARIARVAEARAARQLDQQYARVFGADDLALLQLRRRVDAVLARRA